MTDAGHDITLAEYLRVLRHRWRLIAAVTALCGFAAIGFSVTQTPTYEARATLTVSAPNADLTLLGGVASSNETPQQFAQAHAQRITRNEVIQKVQRDVTNPLSVDQVRSAVDVSVDPASNQVGIAAHAHNARDAAAIANAVARDDVSISTAEARRTYAQAAISVSRKLHSLQTARDSTTRVIYVEQLSRLQSLSTFAAPVSIATSATAPSRPSSPRPVRNALAGVLIGLFLGIGLAYARDALDPRLRDPADIEKHFGRPLMGYVRKDALGHAGALTNGLGPLDELDLEGFRILRQSVRYLSVDEDLRSIAVTSALAEEGKSTVAASLAMASAEAGMLTLLIECDLRRPVLADRLALSQSPGLTDYLIGNASPREILQRVPTTGSEPPPRNGGVADLPTPTTHGSLTCITAGTPAPQVAELFATERFQTLLHDVSEVYDTVLLDTSPLLPVVDTLDLIPYVSGLLVCVRTAQTTRNQALAVRRALERFPDRPTGLVVTGLTAAREGYYGYYGARYGPRDTRAS